MNLAIQTLKFLIIIGLIVSTMILIANAQPQSPGQSAPPSVPSAPSAQAQIEQTIGALIVRNATCSQQTLALSDQLRAAQAELAKLKALGKTDSKPTGKK